MSNKNSLFRLFVLTFILLLTTIALSNIINPQTALAQTKKFKWKCFMGGPGGRGSASIPNTYLFVASDEIKRQTRGQLIINPVAGKALGLSSSDMVRSLHHGLVQMADFSAGVASGEIPSINLIELPGVLPGGNTLLAKKIYGSLLPYWQESLRKKGTELLAGYLSIGRNIFTTKKLSSLDQIKGMKIRAKAASDGVVLRAFGAIPTPISFGETEMALRRGTVDGMTTVSQGITGLKVTDITKTGFLSYYSGTLKLVGVSKKFWDQLPPAFQKTVRDVFVDVYDALWYASIIRENVAMEEFKGAGMKLVELTPDQEKRIAAAGEKNVGEWLKKAGPTGKEMLDLVNKLKAGK